MQEVVIHVNSLCRVNSGTASGLNAAVSPSLLSLSSNVGTEMQRSSVAFNDPTFTSPAINTQAAFTAGHFHPWVDTPVVVVGTHQHKAYWARVKEVHQDLTSKSGIVLKLEYEAANASVPMEWVDYSYVRHKL